MNVEITQDQRAELLFWDAKIIDELKALHNQFENERIELIALRKLRQRLYDSGELPYFSSEHTEALNSQWKVAPIPHDLAERRVEITGPIHNPKMVIQMLSPNSEGALADMAMLDFEDSMNPMWENVLQGLLNVRDVARESLTYKNYELNLKSMAHPMVRVRGLHLLENNFRIMGASISAAIFDVYMCSAVYAYEMYKRGKTPKFYIPKCEHYLEARWWHKLFCTVEDLLHLPQDTIRVTFLIETLPASFQMEEILFEVRTRACGLNGGRWDKIFSDIKTLKNHSDRILEDRSTIGMTKPWMDHYAKLLIKTCHKHGAYAMGGMSAFTPGKEADLRKSQIEKVVSDKKREADIGHDGCWVSHPYFIESARSQFKNKNQLHVLLGDFPSRPDLIPKMEGQKTLQGLRVNIRVAIAYLKGWDEGLGCIAWDNLMEDLATFEISRAQVWQWMKHSVYLDDVGVKVDEHLIKKIFLEEFHQIIQELHLGNTDEEEKYKIAYKLAQEIFLEKDLKDFFEYKQEINTKQQKELENELK